MPGGAGKPTFCHAQAGGDEGGVGREDGSLRFERVISGQTIGFTRALKGLVGVVQPEHRAAQD